MENQNYNSENKESELLKLLEKSEKNSSSFTTTFDSTTNNETTPYYKNRTEKIRDFKKGLLFSPAFLVALSIINYIDLVEVYSFIFYQPVYIILSSITLALIIFIISKIVKRHYLISGFLIGVFALPPLTLITFGLIAMSIIFLFTGQTYL